MLGGKLQNRPTDPRHDLPPESVFGVEKNMCGQCKVRPRPRPLVTVRMYFLLFRRIAFRFESTAMGTAAGA